MPSWSEDSEIAKDTGKTWFSLCLVSDLLAPSKFLLSPRFAVVGTSPSPQFHPITPSRVGRASLIHFRDISEALLGDTRIVHVGNNRSVAV